MVGSDKDKRGNTDEIQIVGVSVNGNRPVLTSSFCKCPGDVRH